jgi:hypothetical protein
MRLTARGDQRRRDLVRSVHVAGHREVLKWLAVLPLIPAAPLLLFGLAWGVPVLMAVGALFVAAAVAVWRLFAQRWPMAPSH